MENMDIEEIKERALRLVEAAANGKNIQEDAILLVDEYLSAEAKFKKGQKVWLFYDCMFCKAVVSSIISKSIDGSFWYSVRMSGGGIMTCREDAISATKEELKEHLLSIINESE